MTTPIDSRESRADGTAADYEATGLLRRAVSPTIHPTWRNTLRPVLKPVACWRIGHAYFRFDSSVILPTIADELITLKPLIQEHRVATIFGHADPVGAVEYNARLSARRARALFGLLTRNVEIWLHLYGDAQPYDRWGLASTQTFLRALPRRDDGSAYYAAQIDGMDGPSTRGAIRAFQQDHGLADNGRADMTTCRRLYEVYMDALLGTAGTPLMRPDQFLGDPDDNANPTGKAKAACQGCGEHNPVLLLSKAEKQRFEQQADKTERDERNRPNRRVTVFFFSKKRLAGMTPAEVRECWPCPSWQEGAGQCREHLWPDYDKRLKSGDEERRYDAGENTMGCRWYDRFARLSPCERQRPPVMEFAIRLINDDGQPMARVPYVLVTDKGQEARGTTSRDGEIRTFVSRPRNELQLTVTPNAPRHPQHRTHSWVFAVREFAPATTIHGALMRLRHLDYWSGPTLHEWTENSRNALRRFQADHGLPPSGDLDLETSECLQAATQEPSLPGAVQGAMAIDR